MDLDTGGASIYRLWTHACMDASLFRGTKGETGLFARQLYPMFSIVTVQCVFVIREIYLRTTGTTGN